MKKPSLFIIFLTVFIDVVGFSVIFPLFPEMLDYYLDREGEGSLVAALTRWLEGFAGGDENAVATLFGGLLGSLYGMLQFLFAVVWGVFSDRHGRRQTLVLTLTGTVLSYLLWMFAGSFALLVLSRILGGIMAGNISTASAVVADVTDGKDRAKGMGIIGMGVGLGFVLGPALGGLTSSWVLAEAGTGMAAFGLHPFSGPAAVSLLLAALNWALVVFRLPESLPVEKRGQAATERTINPFARLKAINLPGVALVNLLYFAFWTSFASVEFTLTFFATERFNFGPLQIAWMFVFIGFTLAFFQGGMVRLLVRWMGERRTATVGIACTVPGFLVIGFAASVPVLYLGLFLIASGSGMAMPSLSALVSRYSPAERQGLALGVFRSLGSLSRAIGPVIGGLLYWKFGNAMPYWVGAAFLLLPIGLALRLPPLPEAEERPKDMGVTQRESGS